CQSRLYDLQQKQFLARGIFGGLGVRGEVFFSQLAGGLGVLPFFIRQFVQQFARRNVGGPRDRPVIEPLGLQFHHFRLLPSDIRAQWADQPGRFALQESLYILPPDQWNALPETLPERGNQPVPVLRFLLAHLFEHLRCRRVRLVQRVGEFAVDAAVLLFGGDRQRQDL